MSLYIKGALLEYSDNFLGPIPNLVGFQFNPEELSREIEIPSRGNAATQEESDQAGAAPYQRINLTAHFSAAERLAANDLIARAAGIGPQLAALEKMVQVKGPIFGELEQRPDGVGERVGGSTPGQGAGVPIPRVAFPRTLFVWGVYRILPVVITSLSIRETRFDHLLNPTQAEVELSLSVVTPGDCSGDELGKGASIYSRAITELLAATNLAQVVIDVGREAVEAISF